MRSAPVHDRRPRLAGVASADPPDPPADQARGPLEAGDVLLAVPRLSDPEAAAYLVDALVARRDAIGRAYLDAVTPLHELVVDGGSLCGVDLALRHGIAKEGRLELLGKGGAFPIGADGRVCLPLPGGAYTVLRLRIRRGERTTPVMQIHLRNGHLRGIVR